VYGSKVVTGVGVTVGAGGVAVGWLAADWGACVAGIGVAEGGAAAGGAAVGGGAVLVKVGSEVMETESVGAATAMVGASVVEKMAGVASTPGILSVHASNVTRIRIDRRDGIRFMSIYPNIRSLKDLTAQTHPILPSTMQL